MQHLLREKLAHQRVLLCHAACVGGGLRVHELVVLLLQRKVLLLAPDAQGEALLFEVSADLQQLLVPRLRLGLSAACAARVCV